MQNKNKIVLSHHDNLVSKVNKKCIRILKRNYIQYFFRILFFDYILNTFCIPESVKTAFNTCFSARK